MIYKLKEKHIYIGWLMVLCVSLMTIGNWPGSKIINKKSCSSSFYTVSLVPDGKNALVLASASKALEHVSSMKPVSTSRPSVRNISGSASDANYLTIYFQPGEIAVITDAAIRNHCFGENYLILLGIRKAENGRKGFEFGVIQAKGTDLKTQAGWAAATVVKNRNRWLISKDKSSADYVDFVDFLADRYVPPSVDRNGNLNFKKNVRFWVKKFQEAGGRG